MAAGYIYIMLGCLLSFAMTWSVGANDLANIMSTAMGSKAVSVKNAMLIAIVFEFAGAFFGGTGVSHTIQSGIININAAGVEPGLIIYGMLSVLCGATSWMLVASFLGLPVSITNAVVGSIVGFGVLVFGLHAIHWPQVTFIILSWVCSPTLAALFSYLLFISTQRLVFDTAHPHENANRFLPVYLFLVGMILGDLVILKGMSHWDIHFNFIFSIIIILLAGVCVTLIGRIIIAKIKLQHRKEMNDRFYSIERMFAVLMAFTAAVMVFAHGSNDVAVIGPMGAITNLVENHCGIVVCNPLHRLLIPMGCAGVLLGLFMYGRRVIETVGSGITALTPSRAFAATLGAAITVATSTGLGIPVSATQTLVGGVLGVGLARGIGALNLAVVRNIFMSWIFTIPAACTFTIGFFYLLRQII